jgi:hypothetical protein
MLSPIAWGNCADLDVRRDLDVPRGRDLLGDLDLFTGCYLTSLTEDLTGGCPRKAPLVNEDARNADVPCAVRATSGRYHAIVDHQPGPVASGLLPLRFWRARRSSTI